MSDVQWDDEEARKTLDALSAKAQEQKTIDSLIQREKELKDKPTTPPNEAAMYQKLDEVIKRLTPDKPDVPNQFRFDARIKSLEMARTLLGSTEDLMSATEKATRMVDSATILETWLMRRHDGRIR